LASELEEGGNEMEAFEEGKVNPSADCGGEDWMVFTLGECL